MARRTRKPFYLVFSKDPPAVDIVKHDDLVPLAAVGAEAAGSADDTSFKWELTADLIEIVKGRILDKGNSQSSYYFNEACHFSGQF